MATVRDLYTKVSKETVLGFDECRHLCRTMQQAGLLPKGTRGGWKDAPQIDEADCARFLLALASTRAGEPRTVKGITEGVRRLGGLVWRDGRYRETFEERLILTFNCPLGLSYLTPWMVSIWHAEFGSSVEIEYRWGGAPHEPGYALQIFGEDRRAWTDKESQFFADGGFAGGFQFHNKIFAVLLELLERGAGSLVIHAEYLKDKPPRGFARLERPLRASSDA